MALPPGADRSAERVRTSPDSGADRLGRPGARRRPMIDVRALRKEYPVGDESVVALERIDLAVPRGQICCIFGESGSGKSTLLNQLA